MKIIRSVVGLGVFVDFSLFFSKYYGECYSFKLCRAYGTKSCEANSPFKYLK